MRIDPKAEPTSRRVYKRGQQKKVHLIAPNKCLGMIQTESRLEASGAIAMSLDPRVVSFRPQPITFDLQTGRRYASKEAMLSEIKIAPGQQRVYTPDFEATFPRGKTYVEFKHSALIRKNPKTLTLPSILARYGYRLIIVDESFLPETFVQNIRLLNISLKSQPENDTAEKITLACKHAVPIRQLLDQGFDQSAILTLVANSELTCDLINSRLNKNTLISTSAVTANHLMQLPFHYA